MTKMATWSFDDIDFEESRSACLEEQLWERFSQADYQPEAKPNRRKVMRWMDAGRPVGWPSLNWGCRLCRHLMARLKRQREMQQHAISAHNEQFWRVSG